MEKKFLKIMIIVIIFFVGLSMGVSYQENNRTRNLQEQLSSYQEEITDPNNTFEPVNPYENATSADGIENNVFSSIAKDGEYVLKKGLQLILDKSDDVFRFVFGLQ